MIVTSVATYGILKSLMAKKIGLAMVEFGRENGLGEANLAILQASSINLDEATGTVLKQVFDTWPDLDGDPDSVDSLPIRAGLDKSAIVNIRALRAA